MMGGQTANGLVQFSAFFASVLAGVLSALLILGAGYIYRNTLEPWFRGKVYRGLQVAGEWRLKSDRLSQKGTLTLHQQADRLWGEGAFLWSDEGVSYLEPTRPIIVEGTIRDRFVHLFFRHRDPDRLGIGAIVVEVTADGQIMEGYHTFHNARAGGISDSVCRLVRPAKEEQLSLYYQDSGTKARKAAAEITAALSTVEATIAEKEAEVAENEVAEDSETLKAEIHLLKERRQGLRDALTRVEMDVLRAENALR